MSFFPKLTPLPAGCLAQTLALVFDGAEKSERAGFYCCLNGESEYLACLYFDRSLKLVEVAEAWQSPLDRRESILEQ